MCYNKTWYLHRSPTVRIRDFTCSAPHAFRGPEMHASADHLLFTRRGVFSKHTGRDRRNVITAEPGHVLLYNAQEAFHTSHPGNHGDAGTVLAFDPGVARDVVRRYDPSVDDRQHGLFTTSCVLASPAVLARVFRMRRRLTAGLATSLEVEEEALGILAETVRDGVARDDRIPHRTPRRSSRHRRQGEIIEAVKQRLATAPETELTLSELATEVGMSPFYLTRMFRQHVGVPVHQYLLRVRLATALEHLDDSGGSLSVVGLDLGFANHSHFTSAFRRFYGSPPSSLRMAG